jgi:hypothetical protein
MTLLKKSLLAASTGAAVLTLSAACASAAVVCAGPVCWHTHERYEYPPSARVVVHDDDWKWKKHEKYRWREHEGRGYWRGDHWVEFH